MSSRRLQALVVAAALFFPAVCFAFYGQFQGLGLTALGALFWIYGLRKAKNWSIQIGFTLTVIGAAFASLVGMHPVLSLVAVVLALAAWDLCRFLPRCETIRPAEAGSQLRKIHLRRLGWTMLAGTLAGLAADLIRVDLSFTVAVVLSLAVLIFLALAAHELIRTGEAEPGEPSH